MKIPVITEAIDEEVMEMEPFVEDYYPKMKNDDEEVFEEINKEEEIIQEEIKNEKVEEEKEVPNQNSVRTVRRKVYPNYRYYYPWMIYPYYPYRNKKNNPR